MKKWFYYAAVLFGLFLPLQAFAGIVQPLPVDKAFAFSVKSEQADALAVHWDIAKGYHLYRDRFHFSLSDTRDAQLGQLSLPPGIQTHDDILGDYQIYKDTLNVSIPVIIKPDNKNRTDQTTLFVTYQGCSESNFCYPPMTKKIVFNMHDLSRFDVSTHQAAAGSYSTMQQKVTHLLEERNYLLICLAFLGLGLLLAFTPCVLPMIPILSGIIVGQDRKNLTPRRAFLLSLSYVLGMSLTYAIAGVLVALLGSHLSETFQAPWVIVLFSLLFVLLALSLFGLYELKLPYFLQHHILHLSNKQKSGSYIGAIIMGALSVLIVSPCVTAPLVGILTFIAQTGSIVLGSTALFALGLGMGLPLLVIGTTEGRFLPKSGYWMNTVKSAFGVLLIGVAIYLIQRILPGPLSLMLWSAFFIILAVYLGVGSYHRRISSGWVKFSKGIGLLLFCYGLILLIGGAMGNSDLIYPLRTEQAVHAEITAPDVRFQTVKTLAEVQNALISAHQQNKMVMMDFYADWCVSCHEMDKDVFSNLMVRALLKNTVLLRVDVTANDIDSQAVQKYFNIIAPPTILFFNGDGKELLPFRVVGALPSNDFLQHLQHISLN
jgi:thiol:disulfide interchange protein DsbD